MKSKVDSLAWERRFITFKPRTLRQLKRIHNRYERRKAKADLKSQ